MLSKVNLDGKIIDYQLKRSPRRTIGLTVNQQGLRVSVPLEVPVSEIDAVLQTKANWIHKKLAEWQNRKSLQTYSTLRHLGLYPLLGGLWKPKMTACGQIQMVSATAHETIKPSESDHYLSSALFQQWIAEWYRRQAVTCFRERIDLFSGKLRISRSPFKLSNAKTRWGSCNNRGVIRLNWRLIQLPLHLIDYVVAHELCHLFEMNHSPAFWRKVAIAYPTYQQARQELRTYTLQD
ncbi:MAG: M48 family metallopeptidase [Nitrosomonas sp.]|nr:M48 family metallopeptidase [Nitrosomonas sp.]